jgi:hypothetical protein
LFQPPRTPTSAINCNGVITVTADQTSGTNSIAITASGTVVAANLIPQGDLSYSGCQPFGANSLAACSSYSGLVVNTGAGCASSVTGVTEEFTSANVQFSASNWSYGGIVRPGQSFAYSGGPITIASGGTYFTVPSWTNVACQ